VIAAWAGDPAASDFLRADVQRLDDPVQRSAITVRHTTCDRTASRVHNNLAVLLEEMGEPERARAYYAQALALFFAAAHSLVPSIRIA